MEQPWARVKPSPVPLCSGLCWTGVLAPAGAQPPPEPLFRHKVTALCPGPGHSLFLQGISINSRCTEGCVSLVDDLSGAEWRVRPVRRCAAGARSSARGGRSRAMPGQCRPRCLPRAKAQSGQRPGMARSARPRRPRPRRVTLRPRVPGPRTCRARPAPPPGLAEQPKGTARPPPAPRCLPVAARSRRPPAPAAALARVPGKALGAARAALPPAPRRLPLLRSGSESSLRPAAPGPLAGVSPRQDVAAADGRPAARCARRRAGGGTRWRRPPRLPPPAPPAPRGGPAALAPRQVRPEPGGRRRPAAPSRAGRCRRGAGSARDAGLAGPGCGGLGRGRGAAGGRPGSGPARASLQLKSCFPALQTLSAAADACVCPTLHPLFIFEVSQFEVKGAGSAEPALSG